MFDHEKFENDVVLQLEHALKKFMEENDDIYIISLDCSRGADSIGVIANTVHYLDEQAEPDTEDFWYYKYCEEEWDLFEDFEEISAYMRKYSDDNSDRFTDPQTCEYTEEFEEHFDRIIESCQKALLRFKQAIGKDYPDLLLTFNIREYFDDEERIAIFEKLNSQVASMEYSEHIEDFV